MTQQKNISIDNRDRPEKNSGELVDFFNTIAPKYDLMNTLLSFGLHFLWRKRAIKEAAIKNDSIILDICGGTGDLSMLAAEKMDSGRAIIYDFSSGMMKKGSQKIKKKLFSDKIFFLCGDVEDLSVKDATFDIVITGFGLRNIIDREKALAESFRVLKPGGKFICLEFSTPVFPPFVFLYNLYSRYVIPLLGSAVAGSRAAYCYLVDSIKQFPAPEEVVSLIESAGFEQATFRRLCMGVAAIHSGTKSKR